MSVDVVVIGAGGFGRETLDVIEAHNSSVLEQGNHGDTLRVLGVSDDRPDQQNLERLAARQYRYLGKTDEIIKKHVPQRFVLAIGDPKIKRYIDNKFTGAGWHAVSVVHPSANIGSECVVGEGNIICAGVQISTNTRFGRHVHVNSNATVGHDTVLESFVSVNPGAVISGEVTVQRDSLVGAASVILQGLQIGSSSTIGASACVVKNVEPNTTVVGVPARPLQRVSDHASIGPSFNDRK